MEAVWTKVSTHLAGGGGGKEKEFVERLVDSGVVVENRKTLCIGFW